MTATVVKIDNFSGAGRVFTRTPLGLAPILRGMLIDHARFKVEVSGVHDFTDNSTGTANATVGLLVSAPLPITAIDAT